MRGILQPGEHCDGGLIPGDGGDDLCQLEASACGALTATPIVPVVTTTAAAADACTTYRPCGGGTAGERVFILSLYATADASVPCRG